MTARPRIYALLGTHAAIRYDNGDRINELRFLNVLSRFADVFYNGRPFVRGAGEAGEGDRIVTPARGDYDLVYVRGNAEVFAAAAAPKIYLGLPYSRAAFESADAVAVTTHPWKLALEAASDAARARWNLDHYFDPATFIPPRSVVHIEQSIDERFDPSCVADPRTDDFKVRFGWGFTIAYMGRLHDNSLPYALMTAAPKLRAAYPDLNIVMAGPSKVEWTGSGVNYVGRIGYAEMPYAISACDMMVYDHDETGHWLGAGKVLDALACGVPVLCRRHEARIEQLSANYPLFFHDEAELIERVAAYRGSEDVRERCHAILRARRNHYLPDAVAARVGPRLMELL